jgi:hypothetical protein
MEIPPFSDLKGRLVVIASQDIDGPVFRKGKLIDVTEKFLTIETFQNKIFIAVNSVLSVKLAKNGEFEMV